jgi:hypothetical protein
MMLSAFKDSILFHNLAALRAWKKIFKNSWTMLISPGVNTFVYTYMSETAGIQCQKMKNYTWELGLRKMILEHVSGNSHVSNKSCFYLHVLLDIVVPGGRRSWSHLKWYKANSYEDKWGLFAEKVTMVTNSYWIQHFTQHIDPFKHTGMYICVCVCVCVCVICLNIKVCFFPYFISFSQNTAFISICNIRIFIYVMEVWCFLQYRYLGFVSLLVYICAWKAQYAAEEPETGLSKLRIENFQFKCMSKPQCRGVEADFTRSDTLKSLA